MSRAEQRKCGIAAIIGRPNVGKSTLMNQLIGQKVAITSDKPQTTRNRIRTVYTDERGQVVFVDTPGIHRSRTKLGTFMVRTAESSVKDVDLVLYLVEPSTFIGEFEQNILTRLKAVKAPVILVINKCDTVKKEDLLPVIARYSAELDFAEIVPVSALRGDNTKDLLDTIFKYMPEGPLLFDEDTLTDQPMRQIAAELIREQALKLLSEEIPHGIAVVIDRMSERDSGLFDIDATIVCERDSHKGIIIGKGGAMLKKIGTAARREIEEMMETQVNLRLWVKVRKEWRNSDLLLRNYGYKDDDK